METINAKEYKENPLLSEDVSPDTDLKNILVEYVGNSLDPEDKNVTVEMIVEVFAKEFPEFVFALAEENFIRGYKQGVQDIYTNTDKLKEAIKDVEIFEKQKKKSCKLCEKQE